MLRKITLQVLLISLLILLSTSQAGTISAGINVWTSNGPEGGRINALAIDLATPTILYAGTRDGGVSAIQDIEGNNTITIRITARVAAVDDRDNILNGAINVNDIITGTYTYSSLTADSNPLPTVGDYWHTTSPYGIIVCGGGFVFQTDPNNVNFLVEIVNDHNTPPTDNYLLRSYNNLPLANGATVDHIAWQLDDDTATALSSATLPTTPPNLPDWISIFGLTLEGCEGPEGCDYPITSRYFVRAHVTAVQTTVQSQTWHIATNGSDITGDGSEAKPFATIQHGIDTASHGDTVLAHPGVYKENINFKGKNITVGSLFVTTGDEDYILQTVINGNRNDHVVTFASGEAATAKLSGFTITNGYAHGTLSPGHSGGGIFCLNYSNPTLTHLKVSGNEAAQEGGGLYLSQCAATIQDVIVTNNLSGGGGGGVRYSYGSVSLENVMVAHNTSRGGGAGIQFYHADGTVKNALIADNSGGAKGGGLQFDGCSPTFINVTVVGNWTAGHGGGLNVSYMSQPTLVNSIVWGNSPEQIYFDTDWPGEAVTIEYSDIQGGEAGIVTNGQGPVHWGKGNMDASPQFVNVGLGNYHLADDSPCINVGKAAGAPITDIEGNPRPNPAGSNPDMGAFENPSFPTLPSSERIYFSAGDTLYQMNLDGSGLKSVVQGAGGSESLAVDLTHNKIYLSRWDKPAQILVFDPSARNIKAFSDGPGYGGQGLAIDPSASKMYVGLYYNGVYVMDMNTTGNWIRLVDSASLYPLHGQRGQLQIDSVNRHIYFRTAYNGDCGLCRYIWRVNFDGTNLIKIIPANGGDALALDLTEQKMYFSDVPGNYTVKRANLDGSGLETVLTIPAPYRFCRSLVLDVVQKKMYMSLYDESNSYKGRAIARANIDGSGFEILSQIAGNTASEVNGGIALFLPLSLAPHLDVGEQATPDPVPTGSQLTYTLRVTNTGNVDLHAIITDTLPAHVTPTGILTWTGTITAPGGAWAQQIAVTVDMGYTGTLTNTVQVTTEEGAIGIDSIAVNVTGYSVYLPLVLGGQLESQEE